MTELTEVGAVRGGWTFLSLSSCGLRTFPSDQSGLSQSLPFQDCWSPNRVASFPGVNVLKKQGGSARHFNDLVSGATSTTLYWSRKSHRPIHVQREEKDLSTQWEGCQGHGRRKCKMGDIVEGIFGILNLSQLFS